MVLVLSIVSVKMCCSRLSCLKTLGAFRCREHDVIRYLCLMYGCRESGPTHPG